MRTQPVLHCHTGCVLRFFGRSSEDRADEQPDAPDQKGNGEEADDQVQDGVQDGVAHVPKSDGGDDYQHEHHHPEHRSPTETGQTIPKGRSPVLALQPPLLPFYLSQLRLVGVGLRGLPPGRLWLGLSTTGGLHRGDVRRGSAALKLGEEIHSALGLFRFRRFCRRRRRAIR